MNKGWISVGPDVPGAEQMAIDAAMLKQTEIDSLTRVRLYHFSPPAVSLGFHQKHIDINESLCEERGYSIVRRPTGGRAVLHKGDLVYSISVSAKGVVEDSPVHTGVYNLVSLALLKGLSGVGIQVDAAGTVTFNHADVKDLPKLCFSSATRHEVQINGRKVVGSAQRRGREAVIQHGSILVNKDHLEIVKLLEGVNEKSARQLYNIMEKRTIDLRTAGFEKDESSLVEFMMHGFQEVFGPLDLIEPYEVEGLPE